PNCGCPRIKNGKRRLKLIGTVQNYLCRNCGCQVRDSDFTGYMYPRKIIDAAVSLYQSGITLEYVKISIGRIFGITIKSLSAIENTNRQHAIVLQSNYGNFFQRSQA
ncbi:MAG: hypothetical protein J4473_04855, partial [Candidatus Aenigmarchaeota archaeon]|nr:hypothetical protein [Candidatus Aenigmarchaeota archaeon]